MTTDEDGRYEFQKGEKKKKTTASTYMNCNMLKYTSKILHFPTIRVVWNENNNSLNVEDISLQEPFRTF